MALPCVGEFKVGEYVKCIDDNDVWNRLLKGKIYIITGSNGTVFKVEGCGDLWFCQTRFRKLVEEELKVGDRVKIIKASSNCRHSLTERRTSCCAEFIGQIGCIDRVYLDRNQFGVVDLNGKESGCIRCESFSRDCLEKVKEGETMEDIKKDLKLRIEVLDEGWTKECDDILQEIREAGVCFQFLSQPTDSDPKCKGQWLVAFSHWNKKLEMGDWSEWDKMPRFMKYATGSCAKFTAFKEGLNWLVDKIEVTVDTKRIAKLEEKLEEMQLELKVLKGIK